jgi:hypothetical protein
MIGRAVPTNPWLFNQMQQYALTGHYDQPTEEQRHRLLMDYYGQINAAHLPDGVGKMKQFACWFTHGVGNGSELRRIVHAAHRPAEVLESVERFFVARLTGAETEGRGGAGAVSEKLGVAGYPGAQEDDGRIAIAQNARNEDPAHGPSEHVGCESTRGT